MTGTGASACASPAVPHPAQVAGFTTILYCADYTTTSGINNVYRGVAQNMPAWNMSTFLDCSGNAPNQAGAQWVNQVAGLPQPVTSCSQHSFVTDPKTGTQALRIDLLASNGAGDRVGMQGTGTCVHPNSCYWVVPTGNLLAEVNWRYDNTATTGSNGFVPAGQDFWSEGDGNDAGSRGGCEVDFLEIFGNGTPGILPGNQYSTGGTIAQNCIQYQDQGHQATFTIDGNYHTDSILVTGKVSGTPQISICNYHDYVPSNNNNFPVGQQGLCLFSSRIPASMVGQIGEVILNGATNVDGGGNNVAQNANLYTYIAWVRIWVNGSCFDPTHDPYTVVSSCDFSAPYVSPP